MWRLKIAQGDDPYLYSTNKFVGRQTWEFDPNYANSQELHQVEIARQHFLDNHFHVKSSSDALLHIRLMFGFSEKQMKEKKNLVQSWFGW